MKINANVLDRQFFRYQDEYEAKALEVLRSGYYILGPEVKRFEDNFASYNNVKHCVGLASGLDALWIGLDLLGITENDEVLVQGNTYIATVMSITMNKATPIFVEPNKFHNMDDNIEHLITDKTKAILVTHLYGQATKMDKILELCKKYNLYLIEDCAQAHGATYKGQKVGTFGDLGCFSFYPSKNLGCFGDGGAIITNNEELANKFKVYRNYGSQVRYYNQIVGTNSRLDELQAGLLNVKIKYLDDLNNERIAIANKLQDGINNELIELPMVDNDCTSIYHLFVIKTKYRKELMEYLTNNEIQSLIHYPVPPHLQECYRELGYHKGSLPISEEFADEVLSLPMYNGMLDEEINYLIDKINGFKL